MLVLKKMNLRESEKMKTLAEAARLINDGDTVTFSGISLSAHPVAMAHEMIRQRKRNLEIAGSGAWHVNNLLIGAGCVDKMLIAADSTEIGGVAPALRRAVEKGDLLVEDYSYFAIACRFMAAAIGVPFLPTKSMLGSDMLRYSSFEEGRKFRMTECPFSGEKVVLLPALKPDVAVIHAHQADEDGNVQMFGPTGLASEQSRASSKVIVTVEKIVSKDVIQSRPELTVIPSFVVDAIVDIPFGAHPTALHRRYDYDIDHLQYALEKSRDEEDFKAYLDQFVYGVDDHRGYLKRIGGSKRLRKLRHSLRPRHA
jgi:acyl CoA:acetate/3-ketoacid CoA transferase alpha subunit